MERILVAGGWAGRHREGEAAQPSKDEHRPAGRLPHRILREPPAKILSFAVLKVKNVLESKPLLSTDPTQQLYCPFLARR